MASKQLMHVMEHPNKSARTLRNSSLYRCNADDDDDEVAARKPSKIQMNTPIPNWWSNQIQFIEELFQLDGQNDKEREKQTAEIRWRNATANPLAKRAIKSVITCVQKWNSANPPLFPKCYVRFTFALRKALIKFHFLSIF